jgi:prepilin-type N-terminal cleavage/methylation domain-containing protein
MSRRPRRIRGFTLVELILSLVLFSFISLALVAAMSTLGKTWERTTERLDAAGDLRIVGDFLRRMVGQPMQVFPRGNPADGNPYFDGQSRQLVFIGNFAGHQGPGGIHWVRLGVEGGQLHLDILPWQEDPEARPRWGEAERLVLLDDVQTFELAYLAPGGEDDWRRSWNDAEAYPQAIRLLMQVDDRHWPEQVFWLRGRRASP